MDHLDDRPMLENGTTVNRLSESRMPPPPWSITHTSFTTIRTIPLAIPSSNTATVTESSNHHHAFPFGVASIRRGAVGLPLLRDRSRGLCSSVTAPVPWQWSH